MELEGQVALITGAAKRIGRAVAFALARKGALIVVHYNHSKEEAEQTAEEIKQLGAEAIAMQADLSDVSQVQPLVDKVTATLGAVDILVNSAAVFYKTPVGEVTEETWDDLFRTNIRGPFFLAQAAAKVMKSQGAGKIINFSDATADYAVPDYTVYAMTKTAVGSMTRGLARALAPEIQVNCILPGPILPSESGGEEGWKAAIGQTVLKRSGSPEDIAEAVLFLVEKGDYLTGVFLPVDGGRSLGR